MFKRAELQLVQSPVHSANQYTCTNYGHTKTAADGTLNGRSNHAHNCVSHVQQPKSAEAMMQQLQRREMVLHNPDSQQSHGGGRYTLQCRRCSNSQKRT